MIPAILVLFTLASGAVSAAVYRWVDSDGSTHFSDRPAAGATKVDRADSGAVAVGSDRSPVPPDGRYLGDYTAFEIVAPEGNQTLRQDSADIVVSLTIDPPISDGHRMELVLDGVAIASDKGGTQLVLNGVAYGSHRLVARVLDQNGLIAARSDAVDFHLRKPLPPGVLP